MSNNKQFHFVVPGEPVPKTTKRPPHAGKGTYWIVQRDEKYSRLKRTWDYQQQVSAAAIVAGVVYEDDDPIRLSLNIYKSGHRLGDTKNILAAIEDGLQFGGCIPNDRQIVSYGEVNTWFKVGKADARVAVCLELTPHVKDINWLIGWLGNKKKAVAYKHRNNLWG